MTRQTTFFDWQRCGLDWNAAPWETCSPNLLQVRGHLMTTWGGYTLGCHWNRPIRGGELPSSHAYGSADDWRYDGADWPSDRRKVARSVVLAQVLPFLIDFSAELHVDAIHDYIGDRIWRAGRAGDTGDGWKKQYGAGDGMGEAWATYLHIETHRDGWADSRALSQRFATCRVTRELVRGMTGDDVKCLQRALNGHGAGLIVDGSFGPATEQAVRNYQASHGLTVDGRAGPATCTSLGIWGG